MLLRKKTRSNPKSLYCIICNVHDLIKNHIWRTWICDQLLDISVDIDTPSYLYDEQIKLLSNYDKYVLKATEKDGYNRWRIEGFQETLGNVKKETKGNSRTENIIPGIYWVKITANLRQQKK